MPPGMAHAEVAAEFTVDDTDHSDSDTTATEPPKQMQEREYKLVGETSGVENEPIDKPYYNSISEAPITLERTSYIPGHNEILIDAGTPRATLAASKESPNGTVEGDWAAKHQHQTVRFHRHRFMLETNQTGATTTCLLLGS